MEKKKEWNSYMPSMDVSTVAKLFAKDGLVSKDDVLDVLRVSGLTVYGSQVEQILEELGEAPYSIEKIAEWHSENGTDYVREKDEAEKAVASLVSNNLVTGKAGKVHLGELKKLCEIFGEKISEHDFDKIMKGMENEVAPDGFTTIDSVIGHLSNVAVTSGYS
eukprot:GEMP01091954.1.p1 GENE.GEMP01091954.1~~GEMP01091954.1.p1  ORF type:complete len:163 (+),score=38.35 GEMP01091954.1:77-565(+)